MKTDNLFVRLGLHTDEATIYQALLTIGSGSVSEIAKFTGLYRPMIYKYIPVLLGKNLISQSYKGKRKVYVAESPKRLQSLTHELEASVENALPELLALFTTTTTRPTITFLEGKKGIRYIHEDIVTTCKKDDVIYRYESPKNYRELKKYVPEMYLKKVRDEGAIERLIITNELTAQHKKPRLGRTVKVVPSKYDLFQYNISQFIYGPKVAFIDFDSETVSVIENARFAEFQRKIFKLLFDKL